MQSIVGPQDLIHAQGVFYYSAGTNINKLSNTPSVSFEKLAGLDTPLEGG
jgi:hypothetical protein